MISQAINLKNRSNIFLPRNSGLFGVDLVSLAETQPHVWGFLLEDSVDTTIRAMEPDKRREVKKIIGKAIEQKNSEEDDWENPFPVPDDGGDDNGGGNQPNPFEIDVETENEDDDAKQIEVDDLPGSGGNETAGNPSKPSMDEINALIAKHYENSPYSHIKNIEDLVNHTAQTHVSMQKLNAAIDQRGSQITHYEKQLNEAMQKIHTLEQAAQVGNQKVADLLNFNQQGTLQLNKANDMIHQQQAAIAQQTEINKALKSMSQKLKLENVNLSDDANANMKEFHKRLLMYHQLAKQKVAELEKELQVAKSANPFENDAVKTQMQQQLAKVKQLENELAKYGKDPANADVIKTLQTDKGELLQQIDMYKAELNKYLQANVHVNDKQWIWNQAIQQLGLDHHDALTSPEKFKTMFLNDLRLGAEAKNPKKVWEQAMKNAGFAAGPNFANPQTLQKSIQSQIKQIATQKAQLEQYVQELQAAQKYRQRMNQAMTNPRLIWGQIRGSIGGGNYDTFDDWVKQTNLKNTGYAGLMYLANQMNIPQGNLQTLVNTLSKRLSQPTLGDFQSLDDINDYSVAYPSVLWARVLQSPNTNIFNTTNHFLNQYKKVVLNAAHVKRPELLEGIGNVLVDWYNKYSTQVGYKLPMDSAYESFMKGRQLFQNRKDGDKAHKHDMIAGIQTMFNSLRLMHDRVAKEMGAIRQEADILQLAEDDDEDDDSDDAPSNDDNDVVDDKLKKFFK